jgi:hypothetical protein
MRKNLTEIVFILDRSGSMSGLETDTIGGFNSMIEKQKKENGEALISTVLFDNVSEVIHDRVPVQKVEPMTDRDYSVRGCTALLDAIGGAIHHIGNVHKYARNEDVPEHTLFVITTDGMENASRRYDSETVKKMIERQKEKYGWEFLFLGANIDAVETAKHFGIGADRAVNYHSDREGTQLNYEVLSEAVSAVRCSVPLGTNWKKRIDEDYNSREGREKVMRIITVKGTGNVSARPDYIILSLNIEVLSETYDRAMSEAAERIERLQGAAVRVGYRKEDLKTTSFDVQTRYENVKDRQGNYKREFAGYACSYRLKLAFDFDSKQLAKVISAIADCGAQPELSIAFTVKNPARVSEELLINATENARAKAEILCKASGSTLGQLLNIDYNWGELNVFSRTSYDVEDCIQPLMAMSKCAAPEIEPVDIDVTDTVAFTWEIQ